MYDIGRLSQNIAERISQELNFESDKKEVIEYGIFAILQIILSIISVLIIGAFLNVMLESFITTITIALLRKYSGGAHASSPTRCTFIGTIISVAIPLMLKNVNDLNIVGIIVFLSFILSYYLVYKLAPVDSIFKPIKKEEKIKRLKKGSIIIVSIYLCLVLGNLIIYISTSYDKFIKYSLCICGGMMWQVISLTKLGHKLIYIIETFINKFKK
ncbi:accessory gene regulator ArgB-like protein [Clostridium septicum]|uniref:Accessory gene regulator B family protein n=1 Tax=Clostridium septicum TaxID=1504 RepID=A0ABY5B225_CLOSE|nr:accessory gene regulator B family protein [Clostridium septicum]MDU1312685.1 accessory gene regulator B family protein [Clostridium septicum]UEC20255.1 accessory gene regulator B family protein [Clostridium septicum]USS01692.1 accessory gene regulator B family protein [Clostridium septicum]WLF70264.1 accessory gene regulator B family protein [Clostridium septicum]